MASVFRDDLLQEYPDTELFQHITKSSSLIQSSPSIPDTRIMLLSENLVAKQCRRSEINDALGAIEFAQQLGIPVPPVRRVITDQQNAYCIMDRIEGITLDNIWLNLGWFLTIKVALQLRSIVKRLRSVTSSTAGSLVSGECRSFWLEDQYGLPRRSRSEEFSSFFRFWANFTTLRKAWHSAAQGIVVDSKELSSLESKGLFVFTHHDLAPRNLLLSPSGELWVLDWDFSGFYPIYFEYASMQTFIMPPNWNLWVRLRWYLFTWIAVGYYEQSARLLRDIASKFVQFPVGRRFEVLKIGGPSKFPVLPKAIHCPGSPFRPQVPFPLARAPQSADG